MVSLPAIGLCKRILWCKNWIVFCLAGLLHLYVTIGFIGWCLLFHLCCFHYQRRYSKVNLFFELRVINGILSEECNANISVFFCIHLTARRYALEYWMLPCARCVIKSVIIGHYHKHACMSKSPISSIIRQRCSLPFSCHFGVCTHYGKAAN